MKQLRRLGRPGGLLRLTARMGLVALFLFTFMPAYAQEVTPASPTLGFDDGALEVGVWYVNDYENCGGWGLGDLGNTDDDALSLRNRLTSSGPFFFFTWPTPAWSAPLVWGNFWAWEKDWTRPGVGGWDDSQIDRVDLAYFAGHGASSGWFFGVGGNSRNDCQVTKNDTVNSLGNLDLDWIGMSACNVLDDPFSNYQGWANSMYGLRLFMGFQTVMSDVNFGDTLGWHLRWGRNFTQSWFWAADALLPSDQVARIVAEENEYFYDTWANHASFTNYDNDFYWWTHRAGTPLAGTASAAAVRTPVDIAALNAEMPIFQVAPFSLAEAEGNFAQVANAFNISDTTPISGVVASDLFGPLAGDAPMLVSSDGTLVMDQAAGTYLYIEEENLWSPEAVAEAVAAANGVQAAGVTAVDPGQAIEVADTFLEETGLSKPDRVLQGAGEDVLESGEDPDRSPSADGASVGEARQVGEAVTTNYKVNYSRQLVYTPPSTMTVGAAAVQQTFDVVGPGAKLAVYVDATAPSTISAASTLQDELVLGGQGGWRRLLDVQASGGHQVMATMLPTDTITALFEAIGDQVALDNVPLPGEKEILGLTAGYYEGPMGMSLSELIPVYILTVRNTPAEGDPQTYDVFIPVNASYMAPFADIRAPETGFVQPGSRITLEAADAAQTLADLGVGDEFDFALGSGGDYAYEWFLEEAGGVSLGAGRTLEITMPPGNGPDGKPSQIKVVLVVTDLDKESDPRVASDSVTLTTNAVFLPNVVEDQ